MQHTLPSLPYDYAALEPFIDQPTMVIHHDKHHQAYVDKLNAALAGQAELADKPLEELLANLTIVPEAVRTPIQNNGGGHFNHSFFWQIMTPGASTEPVGELATAINNTFGDFAKFKEVFTQAALGQFGSGWAWLVLQNGALVIYSTSNQDSPIMRGDKPILVLDVWEHAYYLKFQNRRPDYVATWWNVINWNRANELYIAGK